MGREARRGAAAQIDGLDGFAFQIIPAQFQFTTQGGYITCGFFLTHGGEEAAVYTATGAERNMYVNARQTVRSLN